MRSAPSRRLLGLSAAAVLAISLAACGTEDDDKPNAGGNGGGPVACESTVTAAEEVGETTAAIEGETRQFEADNGTIEIPSDPERIVATGYAVPVLVEAEADLVGISTWERGTELMTADDLADYEAIKKVAGDSADSTNYEAIASVKPDLIVLGVPLPVLGDVDMERLESIAPVVVLGPARPDGWKVLSQRQTDAAGEQDYFAEAKASYDEKAAALAEKYADVLETYCFGHVGAYGDVSAGEFHREFEGSWGTNIATDIGVRYYGAPKDPGEGSDAVTEYPSIEELPESFADASAITYTIGPDEQALDTVQYVLDHELWQTLPAVQDDKAIAVKFTEAATYPSAERTLDELDKALAEAFADELS